MFLFLLYVSIQNVLSATKFDGVLPRMSPRCYGPGIVSVLPYNVILTDKKPLPARLE